MDTTAPALAGHEHDAPVVVSSGLKQPYHLVEPSPWPIIGALAAFCVVFGIILVAHYNSWIVVSIGVVLTAFVMANWWHDVVLESHTSAHTPVVRLGLRFGMMLFIMSEVCFFVSFFWAFFNYALFPDNVGNAPAHAVWPPAGTVTFDPFHLPFLNTMILLLSGCTVTWAHHALIENDRRGLLMGLGLTILLGISFTTCQAIEYSDAPFHFRGGVYPSVFFLATGFHGFHVIVGTIFLIVCWMRAKAGGFTPDRHFGFEAAAWYWHFVDVVWLFLFVCIYWWGASPVTTATVGG
ncbi:MAG TPA: cytochrome c oxidase subunit 3 [Acidisphaera sp.]|nr:cytochrome c oxidase subunit 3 [Acidisphaera sp.]